MTNEELLDVCADTLRDVLGDDSVSLSMTTRRQDVPNWDSFAYINFIAAIEMRLHIRFGVADVESFPDVGAIVRRSQALLADKAS